MSPRKPLYAVSGAAVAALTAAGLSLAPATAGATDNPVSEAYAIAAEGLLTVEKTPGLDSSNGFQEKSLASLQLPPDADNPNLSAGALNAMVDEGSAESSIADLNASLTPGNEQFTIKATLIEANCDDGDASSALVDVTIAGQQVPVDAPPNTELKLPAPLDALGGVTINKQVDNEDGSTSVTAVEVDLAGQQNIELAHAKCGPGASDPTDPTEPPGNGDDDDDDNGDDGGGGIEAPRPTPIEGHHPVTG